MANSQHLFRSQPTPMTSQPRRIPVFAERLLLLVGSPLLFLLLVEAAIAITGIDLDLARNDGAQIAVPVWLLADEAWVADRRSKWRREGHTHRCRRTGMAVPL